MAWNQPGNSNNNNPWGKKPGQGGGLLRILTLSFTAPLFLHGYRYFYTT